MSQQCITSHMGISWWRALVTQCLSLSSGRPAHLGPDILVEEGTQCHRGKGTLTPTRAHTHGIITGASPCWKNRLKTSHSRCLGAELSPPDIHRSSSSREAKARSPLPLGGMENELKVWDSVGAASFPVTLQWVCSRPFQGIMWTCGRGHLLYETAGLNQVIHLTTQPLLWWWEIALRLYWAQNFCFCVRLGKGHVCPKSLSIFSSSVPSLHKPCHATSAPTVLMPYMDGHQGFTSGKMFSTGPWCRSELGFTLAKNSPYLKVWLPMAGRVLVVHGGS